MKKRPILVLVSLVSLLMASAVILGSAGVFAQGIDAATIVSTDFIGATDVVVGTPMESAAALLPSKVGVTLKKGGVVNSETLHTAVFEKSQWLLHGASAAVFENGKLSVTQRVDTFRAITGGTYEDLVIETTLRGTSTSIDNNFGVMFRASNISDSGPDSYQGYYVGIGKNAGSDSLVIGYANNGWHFIDQKNIKYEANRDYALKIVMYGNTLAVFLDGELLYKNELSLFTSGRVGVRTYRQLFECSSFTVRTPSTEDLAAAGIVNTEKTVAELGEWTSLDYDSEKTGSYTFKSKIKGTDYEVRAIVNVVAPFEITEELKTLSYKNVKITEGFFREYIKQMICKVVPTAIANVEKETGGMPNIINAAKKNRGESYGAFSGAFYVDSDVHKVLESMCYALSIDPMGDADIIAAQNSIEAKLEEWIPYFVDAQEESGYFDTYYTLRPSDVKFSDVNKHELYCMGHFIEAAIAHYECTGGTDTRLLSVAIKCADYLALTFGDAEGQRKQIAGHQEIELALLKLARCVLETNDGSAVKAHKYANLAAFFLEVRGDFKDRTVSNGKNEYWQDHKKVEEQTEAVGHAVRAQYMYTAMAELAAIDTEYAEKYDNALKSLWNNVTNTKQYVTGGVGQTAANEGFLDSYVLPNATSYCETCAGIANMMWNRSMTKIYSSSAFADQIETDLYNAVLGCVNFDGDKFYYENPLESVGGALRNSWYGTACCPPNLTRTILSLSEYIYNYSDSALYVNQYISNSASVVFGGNNVGIAMTSDMPWSGNVSMTLSMSADTAFDLYIRVPYWTDNTTVKVNGTKVDAKAGEDGYLLVAGNWSNGDKIDIEFSMPIIFEETSEKVTTNIGYVSLRRGPIVYCAEKADNNFNVTKAYIDKNSEITLGWVDSLDGKADPYGVRDMYVIKMSGYTDGLSESKAVEWTFIPFFARLNREQGPMTVYVATDHIERSITEFATPSASYTFSGDSPYNLNDGTTDKSKRWTSWKDGSVVANPWVQYEFDEEVTLSGCKIWWYDDNGGVRLADGFEIYYMNDTTKTLTPVKHDEKYLCKSASGFITYNFEEVKVTTIRIVIKNSKAAPGIVEWELIGKKSDTPKPPVTTTTSQQTTPVVPTTTVAPSTTEAPTTTPGGAQPDVSTSANGTTENGNEGETPNSVLPAILIGGALVAVAAIAVTAIVIGKKKK